MIALYDCINRYIVNFEKLGKSLGEDDIFNALLNSSRNLTTSIAKINLLVESLYSSVILLNLYKRDHSLESKLGPFLQNLHQLDKVTFLTDKYLNEAPVESAIYLGDFISLSFQLNIAGDKRIFYKMLISLICFSKSKECRDKAISLLNELAKSNSSLISEMVQTFFDLYGTEAETTAVEDSSKSDAQFLAKCVQVLINSEQIAEKSEFEVHKFALECVKICHIPRVYHYQPNLFQTFLCKRFDKGEIATFVEKNTSALVNIVFSSSLSDQIKLNTVKTLSKLNANKFISCFVREVNANLDQLLIPLKSVTSTEVEIFKTPQGTLYDKAVVKAAGDTSADKNVRRENKLYSFKDQLAEMELRKDLEAKSKHTDLDLSKLTKKQEEVYKAQLAKEEDVRNRLKLLDGKLSFNLDVLLAMIRSNPLVASIHFKEIPSTLVNLFTSELCYERSKAFTLAISRPMMVSPATCNDLEYNKFVDTAAFTLVRLYRNPADPDNELLQLIARLVEYLYKRTCPNSGSGYDETLNRLAAQNRLSTPAFAFVFPLLRFVLLQLKASAENYDQMVDRCLQVITQHSLHRNDSAEKKGDSGLKDPQNMPNKLVLETLVKFMEKNLPDHEKTAASAVISTVGCINGSAGCGMASPGDIFVLLNSLTHLNDLIRQTCFQALDDLSTAVLPLLKEEDHCKEKLRHRVFIGRFDTLPECQAFANQIFERCAFETSGKMLETILEDDIENANAVLVVPVSEAYRFLLKQYPERLGEFYEKLTKFYSEKAKASVPSTDAFGRPLAKDHVDHYEQRLAVACIFKNIAEYFSEDQVKSFIKFLIPSALSDNNESVRNVMLEAGCQLIDFHGKNNVNYLLDVFEVFLDSAPDDHRNDLVRKSVIIFMGTLAKHIDGSNPKLKPILSKLVETLSTPSQIVQEAVANCLQYLIPKFIDDAPALLQKLLQFLFESEIYGERKGAAYGIAGIVKGLGILSLNKLGIMDALTQAIQAKDKPNNREGALFAFEMLSSMLGRLFEPYIVHILPHLLDCFGDSSVRVRQAADDSAKVIMSKLSAPGVTLIYPAILTALEDDSWRKKTSSIELLGSMAYCAPKQLSQCLPKIVPKLMDVITDSHPKVQRSAAQALKQIGSVIKNPEIQAIVPTLLEALQDPANKTNTSLNTMLTMKFVHVIDPPSLALIMPVIERAFLNRSTETRKMASQIIGNMNALTKSKDLSPYLPSIIPGLKNSLLDPVPEVRGVTARALGAMVKSLGEEILADLLPWLKSMLISEMSSVDRSGAAQGLSEVLGGLGVNSLQTFMPEIIAITERTDVPPHVKDGYIMMFIYLPLVFTQHFAAYISQVVNPILKALADENEFVRETSLRAGQQIVNMYAETAIQLLLPELERGLFDDNWRIRYSSVQLLGDLLFKIIGVTGKMTTESHSEDDNFGTEQSHKAILDAFGEDRRNTILSGLYMGRSDVALQVRQASLHVWKVVVTNTPRTLREILPVLFSLLLGGLASNSSDRQQVAARTLGDLVRKLGERILPEIIPILEEGLESERADQRQGVCIGLSEIIASTSKEMVQAFAESLIPTVKKALFDELPEVRQAAAQTFDQLYLAIGTKALDGILANLVDSLDDPNAVEQTLDTLRNMISFKSKVILPYLVPKVIAEPVNTRALSFISSVAGDSLSKYLPKIIPAILSALSASFGTPEYEQQLEYCRSVVASISDENGSRSVVICLLESISSDDLNIRRAATTLIVTYCVHSKPANISSYRSQLWRGLVFMLSSEDEFILNQSIEALHALTKTMDSKEQIEMVAEISNALRYTISDYDNVILPGFTTNKGILPMMNIFKEALLNPNMDVKEYGATGYRDIIKHASPEALKPSVMGITGPLLRIVADRISNSIKATISDILSIMIFKAGAQLKPFYPQIQVFFMRSLGDANRNVRLQAAVSLSRFATVHAKIDLFFGELLTLLKNTPHNELCMRETSYYALRLAISSAGQRASKEIHHQIIEIVSGEKESTIDSYRVTAASCLGALCAAMDDKDLSTIVHLHLMSDNQKELWTIRHFRSIVMRIALKDSFNRLMSEQYEWGEQLYSVTLSFITSTNVPIIVSGIKTAAYIIDHCLENKVLPMQPLVAAYARGMNNSNNDVKQAVAVSTIFWANRRSEFPIILYRTIVPLLVNCCKEKNTAVRVHAEQALVAMLKLKDPESPVYQKCLKALDSGAAGSLADCVAKMKKAIAKCEIKEEEFDDTLPSNLKEV
ncbi:PREDICTED: eIF-2-alpha kinase activator GCN1-like [Rhagoletis zephyria]|uniref:eIF-2-alpha kinase activator GCN1-like n=1 Tax=Rhagoletis zephyria TaxID=28612 RepID=UPI00081188E4|nr:PREDICTED: eIF-2-alpha kinase activator GCN1-like [Rhagoletis zephyria]